MAGCLSVMCMSFSPTLWIATTIRRTIVITKSSLYKADESLKVNAKR